MSFLCSIPGGIAAVGDDTSEYLLLPTSSIRIL